MLGTKLEVKLASSGNSKNKALERCLYWPVLQRFQEVKPDFSSFTESSELGTGGFGECTLQRVIVLAPSFWENEVLFWDFEYLWNLQHGLYYGYKAMRI